MEGLPIAVRPRKRHAGRVPLLRLDYTNRGVVWIRRVGQRIGVLRPLQRTYRRVAAGRTEAAFDDALRKRVSVGDTVWDVGAHLGIYTSVFAGLVGESGRVVAIEPSPTVHADLAEAVAGYPNVRLVEAALSDVDGTAMFFDTDAGPTSFHGLSAEGGDPSLKPATSVVTMRGDVLAQDEPPSMVKIDVEGFEYEALVGMASTLEQEELHTIGIEVHFQTLARRGLGDAPRQIVGLLESAGFKVRWTDPSHLIAIRSN